MVTKLKLEIKNCNNMDNLQEPSTNLTSRKIKADTLFWEKVKQVHGDLYTYLDTNYVPRKGKLRILCSIHGEFLQQKGSHLSGAKCPKCQRGFYNRDSSFIEKAQKIHKDTYDYTSTKYTNCNTKVDIICKKHGLFKQRPSAHLSGHGCPSCYRDKQLYTNDDFIRIARLVHGDTYNYSKVNYISSDKKVTIICKKHGEFRQTPNRHFAGTDCRSCSLDNIHCVSNLEKEVRDYIQSLGVETVTNKYILGDKEIDIYCPKLKVGIEFNGTYWHSTGIAGRHAYTSNLKDLDKLMRNKHLEKTIRAESLGIHLIHLYEDMWLNKRLACETYLKTRLGIGPTVYGRSTEVRRVSPAEAKLFYESYHLHAHQKYYNINYGLYLDEDLLAVMSFGKTAKQENELTRFCSKIRVIGGASKLFKAFALEYNPKEVISYCDRGWFKGDMYLALGFKLDKVLPPRYDLIYRGLRFNRRWGTKKKLESMFPSIFSPQLTELENCHNMKIHRIYNCGDFRYLWVAS